MRRATFRRAAIKKSTSVKDSTLRRTALVSVYDKTGIAEFARELLKRGFELISTGGTQKLLEENKIPSRKVEDITGFPEILKGRVKTLHPNIFAGILADKDNRHHSDDLEKHDLGKIDLVVVNLYPFEDTIASSHSLKEAIEQIDIGGVALIRAGAKNFGSVNVIVSPEAYDSFLKTFDETEGKIPFEYSLKLARKAFERTSKYDNAINNYMFEISAGKKVEPYPQNILPSEESCVQLRYGENPHQKGVLIKEDFDQIFEVLHGKELSYNNLLDIDAAYNLIGEFKSDRPACAIIKHGNPSGAALGNDLQSAYNRAFETDTLSPFGGIIIVNKKLDFKTSIDIDKLFTEIILAPDFDNDALNLLKKKKNRRLIRFNFTERKIELRNITGGILMQEKDNFEIGTDDLKFVTKKKASDREKEDLLFAFKIVKHTKSNAIVFVKDFMTLAIGGGQPSRIDSTRIAISKAKEFGHSLEGSSVASDAFFPFADGLIELAKAGAKYVIQPGGSVKDEDVIRAADEYGVAMCFTGVRHFRH